MIKPSGKKWILIWRFSFIVFFFFLLVELSGCTSMQRSGGKKDGPPPFPVDMSKVKEPIPRCEKKSRCGNSPSYVVFGQRYYVMENSRGYCERGVASWYGMKFHQRRTSNGERFDTTTMTAAHKTLPLPTYVWVTNLDNGRRVIVKVNDRGPFCDDRIIDLSYVAAVKLGVYPKGTAHVEVKAIDPVAYHRCVSRKSSRRNHRVKSSSVQLASAMDSSNVVSESEQVSGYYIQLGVYSKKENALRAVRKIAAHHVHAKIKIKNNAGKKEYVVQAGPYTTDVKAKQVAHQLKSIGLPTTVISS